jgi:nucleoside-diphosphate-sugar epimerase
LPSSANSSYCQTFGAGTPQNDTRVFAQFARSSINGENIILHTDGKSRGNYCYTSDTVHGLLTILTKGENSATYNIANTEASVTIQEMAEIVAKEISNGKISVTINIPKDITAHGYAPNVDFVLNTDKLKALSWNPKYGIAKMYKRMITDWLG